VQLVALDWIIVFVSLAVAFAPAVWMARRAGSSTAEFFTSGRAAPWWLVGVSMVATTFSTDTPNLVTNLVREGGVAANWAWWAFLLTGATTVFFYARLWRRLGVLTDLEFYELRYSGREATWVRGFRAVYLGVVFNVVIMAAVNLAAVKIANVLLGWSMGQTLLVCASINVVFAATSGLWGVLVTDLLQFGIAMTGSVAAAVYALRHPAVGGLDGLFSRLEPRTLALLPDFSDLSWRCPSSSCRWRCSGGRPGTPGRSRAAAATSPSGCWRRAANATRWRGRCCSPWRTTRCGRGRG
jgi:solute:Na+ symporter, SSS family